MALEVCVKTSTVPLIPEVSLCLSTDAPGPVVGLELTYLSETELRLQWSRPEGLLPNIPTSYTVLSNNTAQDDDIQASF